MKTFESFMKLVVKMSEEEHRTIHASASAWLAVYELSKEAYDKYGSEGPPIGSKVLTLVAGHSGGPFLVKEIVEDRDGYFLLRFNNGSWDDRGSLLLKKYWFLNVLPHQGAEWENKVYKTLRRPGWVA